MTQKRQVVAILFADAKGYSDLGDDRLCELLKGFNDEFQRRYLNPSNHVFVNTWGDAFFICSHEPMDAAEIALDLRDYYRNQNWKRLGFPARVPIRIGLHAAPATLVYQSDRVADVIGLNVNAAARIEPIAEANEVYCSESFWQLLSKDPHCEFLATPLGQKELAKSFGLMRLYMLFRPTDTKAAAGQIAIQSTSTEAGRAQPPELLLIQHDERMQFCHLLDAKVSQDTQITLRTETPEADAFLRAIQKAHRAAIGVVWDTTAGLYEVFGAEQNWQGGSTAWKLVLREAQTDYGGGVMQMATAGRTADEIAELRARRILLNDPPLVQDGDAWNRPDDTLLEALVRRQNAPISVESSPLPKLYTVLGDRPEYFMAAARLLAILWLKLSGTIEHVLELSLNLEGAGTLVVSFRGRRARVYGNVDPPVIAIEGRCTLRSQ